MKIIPCLIVLLGSLTIARAQTSFTAELDPFQEIPPHNTPGYGEGDFTLSGTTLSVDLDTGTYGGLLGGATSVRISDALAGANGPTVFLLTLDTYGQTSGTFSGSGTLTAAQITDLQNESLYVNLADSVYPSGEIRGQLIAAPEPSTLALLGVGVLLCGRRLRSRR